MKQTIINLSKAFAGESQARNKYTMFASVAKKEGYEQIAAVFLETADQEREHASVLYKMLNELEKKEKITDAIAIDSEVGVVYGTTLENLKAAMAGEDYERNTMYVEFAETAQAEGFKEIAVKLRLIAVAETHHSERYSKLIKELEEGTIFKKAEEIVWTCRECGFTRTGNEPPDECPLCGHAKGFYQKKLEEY